MTMTDAPAGSEALAMLDDIDAGNLDALATLVRDAGTDPAALARLRRVFADAPALANRIGGLLFQVEHKLLSAYPDGYRETLQAQARQMRKALNGEASSELEKLLVKRVVLDWLASLEGDRQRVIDRGESRSLELSRFYDDQAERAQRRFLRSCESLARVRRLMQPIAQVNIAERQVNVGQQQVNLARSANAAQAQTAQQGE